MEKLTPYETDYNWLCKKLFVGMYITINQICKGFSYHDLWCLSNFELSDLYCSCYEILNSSQNSKINKQQEQAHEKQLDKDFNELMEGF